MDKRSPAWMVEEWRKQGFSGQTHRKALFGEVFQAMPGDGAVRPEQLLVPLHRSLNREILLQHDQQLLLKLRQ